MEIPPGGVGRTSRKYLATAFSLLLLLGAPARALAQLDSPESPERPAAPPSPSDDSDLKHFVDDLHGLPLPVAREKIKQLLKHLEDSGRVLPEELRQALQELCEGNPELCKETEESGDSETQRGRRGPRPPASPGQSVQDVAPGMRASADAIARALGAGFNAVAKAMPRTTPRPSSPGAGAPLDSTQPLPAEREPATPTPPTPEQARVGGAKSTLSRLAAIREEMAKAKLSGKERDQVVKDLLMPLAKSLMEQIEEASYEEGTTDLNHEVRTAQLAALGTLEQVLLGKKDAKAAKELLDGIDRRMGQMLKKQHGWASEPGERVILMQEHRLQIIGMLRAAVLDWAGSPALAADPAKEEYGPKAWWKRWIAPRPSDPLDPAAPAERSPSPQDYSKESSPLANLVSLYAGRVPDGTAFKPEELGMAGIAAPGATLVKETVKGPSGDWHDGLMLVRPGDTPGQRPFQSLDGKLQAVVGGSGKTPEYVDWIESDADAIPVKVLRVNLDPKGPWVFLAGRLGPKGELVPEVVRHRDSKGEPGALEVLGHEGAFMRSSVYYRDRAREGQERTRHSERVADLILRYGGKDGLRATKETLVLALLHSPRLGELSPFYAEGETTLITSKQVLVTGGRLVIISGGEGGQQYDIHSSGPGSRFEGRDLGWALLKEHPLFKVGEKGSIAFYREIAVSKDAEKMLEQNEIKPDAQGFIRPYGDGIATEYLAGGRILRREMSYEETEQSFNPFKTRKLIPKMRATLEVSDGKGGWTRHFEETTGSPRDITGTSAVQLVSKILDGVPVVGHGQRILGEAGQITKHSLLGVAKGSLGLGLSVFGTGEEGRVSALADYARLRHFTADDPELLDMVRGFTLTDAKGTETLKMYARTQRLLALQEHAKRKRWHDGVFDNIEFKGVRYPRSQKGLDDWAKAVNQDTLEWDPTVEAMAEALVGSPFLGGANVANAFSLKADASSGAGKYLWSGLAIALKGGEAYLDSLPTLLIMQGAGALALSARGALPAAGAVAAPTTVGAKIVHGGLRTVVVTEKIVSVAGPVTGLVTAGQGIYDAFTAENALKRNEALGKLFSNVLSASVGLFKRPGGGAKVPDKNLNPARPPVPQSVPIKTGRPENGAPSAVVLSPASKVLGARLDKLLPAFLHELVYPLRLGEFIAHHAEALRFRVMSWSPFAGGERLPGPSGGPHIPTNGTPRVEPLVFKP